jgi:hypothetical protein
MGRISSKRVGQIRTMERSHISAAMAYRVLLLSCFVLVAKAFTLVLFVPRTAIIARGLTPSGEPARLCGESACRVRQPPIHGCYRRGVAGVGWRGALGDCVVNAAPDAPGCHPTRQACRVRTILLSMNRGLGTSYNPSATLSLEVDFLTFNVTTPK